MKIINLILLCFVLVLGNVLAEEEYDDEMATEVMTSKELKDVKESNSKTMTTTDMSETTTDEGEYETDPPKGILGKFLMDGPDLNQLPKGSPPEKTYTYLVDVMTAELKKNTNYFLHEFHEYFFLLQELVSQKCFLSLMRWAQNAQKGQPRALKILDSSAKLIRSGLTEGTFADLGDFDQCIRADDSVLTDGDKPMNGRYCLVKFIPPLPERRPNLKHSDIVLDFRNTSLENGSIDYALSSAHSLYSNPFTYGFCFVSDCEPNDIKNLMNNSLHKFNFGVEMGNDCYTEEVVRYSLSYFFNRLDSLASVSVTIIGLLCAVVGLATFSEVAYNLLLGSDTDDSGKPLILYFSLISNVKKLFSLSTDSEDSKELQSINGIKVMAILWVVFSNVYLLGYQPQIRAIIKGMNAEMSRRGGFLPFQVILNSWNASEIFFLFGGLLMSYTITTHLNRSNGKINLIKYFGKRLIRLTPPMVFPILLTFLMPLFPNGGPVYRSSTERLRDTCAHSWWKPLLFINNWFDPDKTCLPHLWFVSAFVQLNLIAMFVLIVTYKRDRLFNGITGLMVLIGIAVPMTLTYCQNLSAKSAIMDRPLLDEIPEVFKQKHFQTFNHLSVFFVGVFIGVKSCSLRNNSINPLISLGLWLVLPLISLISILITYLWNDLKSEPPLGLSIVWNGLNRIFFISGIAWIIYECVNKRGGLVAKVLGNKQFLPLSRLIYQIYLLNLFVVWFYFFTKRDLIVYRDFELIIISCGVFVLTVFISIFGYLVFEAPFVRLSRRLFATSSPTVREIKSQLSGKHISLVMDSIEINGNTITNDKKVSNNNYINDENIKSRL